MQNNLGGGLEERKVVRGRRCPGRRESPRPHPAARPQDTFQDYQEMFVQFGYVVLFSSAFPLAALCALINNLIEIRSDALKLCTGLQRPFGQRVESIGQWQVGGGLRAPSRGAPRRSGCWGGWLGTP